MFVDWQWAAVWRGDAVPLTVNSLDQTVVPSCPTGIQHRVLELTQQMSEDHRTAEQHNQTMSCNVLGSMV